jgi:hypothetical protein
MAIALPIDTPPPMWVAVLERFVPSQGGALWIGVLVTFLVAGDLRQLFARRNLILAGLLAMAVLLIDVFAWGKPTESPARKAAGDLVFAGIYAITAGFTLAGFFLARRQGEALLTPNLPRPGLRALFVVLLVLNVVVALGRKPDDCGYYTNLGAQRWVETGTIPYGDAALKGPTAPGYGAAATYGPLLYAAHMPFQALLGRPENASDLVPVDKEYVRPPDLASSLACLMLHLCGVVALLFVGRRLMGWDGALAAACLYLGSPYVLGLGGQETWIGGLAYISHIAPTSALLMALWCVPVPFLAGVCLGIASGLLFFPAFFFPLWFGWFFWNKKGAFGFLWGFVLTGGVLVYVMARTTHPPPGQGFVRMFLESTLEHQEGIGEQRYGASLLSFWGHYPGLARYLQQPLFGSGSLWKPMFLLFVGLCGAGFFLARGRSQVQLVALTAMLAAGVQLWKTHAGGTYVEWYYPFVLLALFAPAAKE